MLKRSWRFRDEEEERNPRMTKDSLRRHCKEQQLYMTPYLNDVLYLHYKGYSKIENLEEYTGLKCLWLENNGINRIENLDQQKELRNLYLHHNLIRVIENLEEACPKLDSLNLCHNSVGKIENLSGLKLLTTLSMSHNRLQDYGDLEHLQHCQELSCLDISHNWVEDAAVVDIFEAMPSLKVLYLTGNPVVKHIPSYRKTLTVRCKELLYLDDRPVFPKDRAAAEAWSTGGLEAERACRKKWADEEQAKITDSVKGLLRLRDQAREIRAMMDLKEAEEKKKKEEEERQGSDSELDDKGLRTVPSCSSTSEDEGGDEEEEEETTEGGLVMPWRREQRREGRKMIVELAGGEAGDQRLVEDLTEVRAVEGTRDDSTAAEGRRLIVELLDDATGPETVAAAEDEESPLITEAPKGTPVEDELLAARGRTTYDAELRNQLQEALLSAEWIHRDDQPPEEEPAEPATQEVNVEEPLTPLIQEVEEEPPTLETEEIVEATEEEAADENTSPGVPAELDGDVEKGALDDLIKEKDTRRERIMLEAEEDLRRRHPSFGHEEASDTTKDLLRKIDAVLKEEEEMLDRQEALDILDNGIHVVDMLNSIGRFPLERVESIDSEPTTLDFCTATKDDLTSSNYESFDDDLGPPDEADAQRVVRSLELQMVADEEDLSAEFDNNPDI